MFDIRQVLGDGRQSMKYQWKVRGSVDGMLLKDLLLVKNLS